MGLVAEAAKTVNERVARVSKRGWLPVFKLEIYAPAQRGLNAKWVADQVPLFDPEGIGYPVVNRSADGKLYVIDGQHRIALLRAVGWADQQVECEIYDGLNGQEMAEEFLRRNTKINIKTFDKFRIRITAEDAVALAIEKIVERSGLILSSRLREGHVQCVAAMEKVYRGGNLGISSEPRRARALSLSLGTILAAWGKSVTGLNGSIVEGLGLLFLRYGDKIDQATLVKKLSVISGGPSAGLLGRARSLCETRGGSIARCIASIAVDIYNRGKNSKKIESWWK